MSKSLLSVPSPKHNLKCVVIMREVRFELALGERSSPKIKYELISVSRKKVSRDEKLAIYGTFLGFLRRCVRRGQEI